MNFVFVCANPLELSSTFADDTKSLLTRFGFSVSQKHSVHSGKVLRYDLTGPQNLDEALLKRDLIALSDLHRTDLALMKSDIFYKPKKLLVFDMDSTLIQHEVIDEMAMAFGIGDQVKMITKRAMNGELNFDQSLSERVGLLKGLKKESLEKICSTLTLMPGAEKLIQVAKQNGAHTVIASGGFSFFADQICKRLGMHEFYANTLEWNGDTLTGKVSGEVVNAAYKAQLLEKLARKMNLGLDEVVAVGDGANDIPMLLKAGLGFAFHAKEKVRHEANHQMNFGPMHTLLYFLNITGEHF